MTGNRLMTACTAVALLIFLALASATSFVRAPSRDEAWFANPAVSWIEHGHTGSPMLQEDSWLPNLPAPVRLTRIDERTYWIMPVHMLAQRAWYAVTGVGLIEMRALSVLAGLVGLIGFFVYVRGLFGSAPVAALGVALLAIDFRWITMSGNGRMDVLAATFSLIACAWYVGLRERSRSLAVAGSVVAACAGVLTHPVAVSGAVGVVVLVVRLDAGRLRLVHVLAGLTALLACGAAYGLYAVQDLEAFRDQLTSNAAGRFDDLVRPSHAVVMILSLLFATSAFGGTVGLIGVLIPLLLAAGVAASYVWREPAQRSAVGTVLWQLGATVIYLMFFESQKLHFYLVHVTPWAIALTSAFAVHMLRTRTGLIRRVVVGALAALVLVQLAPTGVRLLRQERARAFTPAATAVAEAAGPSRRVVGSPEFAFALGFDRVSDDRRLRLARLEPDAVVVIAGEDTIFWPWLSDDERRSITAELAARPMVFKNASYAVYGPRR